MQLAGSPRSRVGVAAVALLMTVAACGGGGSKKAASTNTTTQETTSTTAVEAAGSSTTTVAGTPAPSVAGVTATTAKTSATTAKRATTATTARPVLAPSSPIAQVTAPPTTAPSSNIHPGGTLTYISGSEVGSLDPAMLRVGGPVSQGQPLVALFDVIVFEDTTGAITPQTAQSLTSSDAVVWTLKLQPNIKFSDGTPYDANAIKFNWQRILDPATASPNLGAASVIKSLDVVDAQTLRITLTGPAGQFPRAIARNLSAIGSPTALRANATAFASNPIGAGPFVLKSWLRDSAMTMVRNPNYWDAPRPYVDQLIIRPLTDTTQRTSTLITGDAQMAIQQNLAEGKRAADAGFNNPATILSGGATFDLNNTTPPFNDVRVRKAVAYAYNFAAYNASVENNLNQPVTNMFIPGSPFYDPSLVLPTNNPQQAQALFDQVFADTGKQIEFTISCSPTSANRCQFLQGDFQAFNHVKVNVESLTAATLVGKQNSKDYQMITDARQYVDPEPDFYSALLSTSASNVTGFKDPNMDAALNAGRSSLDLNARIAAYKQVQQIFIDQVPWLYYAALPSETLYSQKVQDVHTIEDGVPLFDRIWLKP
jgi:peptide/nickel transport system substrate-binding protein